MCDELVALEKMQNWVKNSGLPDDELRKFYGPYGSQHLYAGLLQGLIEMLPQLEKHLLENKQKREAKK